MLKNRNLLKKTFYIMLIISILSMAMNVVMAADFEKAKDSVVAIGATSENGDSYIGTGFAIGEPGKPIQFIVTNAHVVFDEDGTQRKVEVCYSAAENKFVSAEIFVKNIEKDIAVLRLPTPTTERKAMVICPTNKVNMGDNFAALGFPPTSVMVSDFVKFDKSDIRITTGSISNIKRINSVEYYLINIEISGGNSGGPLVNSKGEVIGINSMGTKIGDVKTNYAITIDELLSIIDRDKIPYTVTGEITMLMWLYIGAGVLALIIIAVLVIVLSKRKKPAVAPINVVNDNYIPPVPQPAKSSAFIRGLSGYFVNQSFQLTDRIVIGRDNSKCTVTYPLDAPGISGTHCELSVNGNDVYLKDLGSSYGTFLANGQKLEPNQPTKMGNGAIFYLAGEDNTFEIRM